MDECKPLMGGARDATNVFPPESLAAAVITVGWCRLIVSKPVLNAPMLAALETIVS